MPKLLPVTFFLFIIVSAIGAKDMAVQVINWPPTGNAIVRVSLGKPKEVGALAGARNYAIDTAAENLWGKKISHIGFNLYLYDKNKARIGEGWIVLDNVAVGQTVKFQTMVGTSGVPVTVELVANSLPTELQPLAPARKISMTVNSVPQGATLSVDGAEAGVTPKMVELALGKHSLGFTKEGFNAGTFPVEVGPDDVSGGSVSYELGTSAHDTLELRDGTVLVGDFVSASGTEIRVRVAGAIQTLERNKIKRIILTERDPAN